MVQCKSWEQSRRSWSARCMSSAGLQHRSWAAQSCKSRFRRRPRKSARQPHISGPDCDKLRSPPLLQAQFAASLLGIPAATGLTSKMSSKKNADFLVINMLFFMVPKIVLVFPIFLCCHSRGFTSRLNTPSLLASKAANASCIDARCTGKRPTKWCYVLLSGCDEPKSVRHHKCEP